jgi:ribosomal protein L7/L12
MNKDFEMPAEIVVELQANRKVTAIKLLRAQQGIGLKEAKELVDAYVKTHPSNPGSGAQEAEGGIGRVLLIVGVGLIYALYRYLT